MAAGLLPAQAAMKWLVVLSAEAGRRKAWGAAGFFVSLASFDYQRLRAECLWHQACSWKRPSGCEWDDSGRNVTQKYLGHASHPAGVKGKAPISKMSAFEALRETVLCVFFQFIHREAERATRMQRSSVFQEEIVTVQLQWKHGNHPNCSHRDVTHPWHNTIVENNQI